MSKTKRRERAENWTRGERDILLEIIKNYRHILDNQANNANTNKLKNIVWNHINNRFHELSNSSRDVNQLKSFWKRLKTAARKKARSQMNGSATSDNEKLSHGEDSSAEEPTNNLSTYDNDDSMFGKTCNPSEVVLLIEPKGDHQNLDEGVDGDNEEIHGGSLQNDLASMKYDNNIDYDSPSQNSRLQNKDGVKKNHISRTMKNSASTQDNKSEDNYSYKEFLLKRFYLRMYHKNQIKHQREKHKLEIENLLLERKKIELDIELSKKKLDLLDK